MAQLVCELGDASCTFPMCPCAMIDDGPQERLVTDDMPPSQATEGAAAGAQATAHPDSLPRPVAQIVPHPEDPHPQCGSVTIAENDAARQLITEWMAHQDANPGFWLTWGAVELVVRHMRMVGGSLVGTLVAGNAAILNDGPRCHPGAYWMPESNTGAGTSRAVCSICRQPDTPSYVQGAGGALIGQPLPAFDINPEAMRQGPYVASAGPPACHPFAVAMSKGDGTLVCSHCGVEVGKQI